MSEHTPAEELAELKETVLTETKAVRDREGRWVLVQTTPTKQRCSRSSWSTEDAANQATSISWHKWEDEKTWLQSRRVGIGSGEERDVNASQNGQN